MNPEKLSIEQKVEQKVLKVHKQLRDKQDEHAEELSTRRERVFDAGEVMEEKDAVAQEALEKYKAVKNDLAEKKVEEAEDIVVLVDVEKENEAKKKLAEVRDELRGAVKERAKSKDEALELIQKSSPEKKGRTFKALTEEVTKQTIGKEAVSEAALLYKEADQAASELMDKTAEIITDGLFHENMRSQYLDREKVLNLFHKEMAVALEKGSGDYQKLINSFKGALYDFMTTPEFFRILAKRSLMVQDNISKEEAEERLQKLSDQKVREIGSQNYSSIKQAIDSILTSDIDQYVSNQNRKDEKLAIEEIREKAKEGLVIAEEIFSDPKLLEVLNSGVLGYKTEFAMGTDSAIKIFVGASIYTYLSEVSNRKLRESEAKLNELNAKMKALEEEKNGINLSFAEKYLGLGKSKKDRLAVIESETAQLAGEKSDAENNGEAAAELKKSVEIIDEFVKRLSDFQKSDKTGIFERVLTDNSRLSFDQFKKAYLEALTSEERIAKLARPRN